jgi:hypothetical protein
MLLIAVALVLVLKPELLAGLLNRGAAPTPAPAPAPAPGPPIPVGTARANALKGLLNG